MRKQIDDYRDQLQEELLQVASLRNDPSADEYDIKKAQEIAAETENLIPTLISQLRGWVVKLEGIMNSVESLDTLSATEEAQRTAARECWQLCSGFLQES